MYDHMNVKLHWHIEPIANRIAQLQNRLAADQSSAKI